MLDVYSAGKATRISPEAPVPVLLRKREESKYVLGGAANVAVNLQTTGVNVALFSVVGQDANGKILEKQLADVGINTDYVFQDESRITTTKLRYIGQNNQQLLRVDMEEVWDIQWELVESKLKILKESLHEYSLLVLSDYQKGFLTQKVSQYLIELANTHTIPILVDVKGQQYNKYKGAFLLKPNREELRLLTGMPVDTIEDATKAACCLCGMVGCQYVLATLGVDGMVLSDNKGLVQYERSMAQEVYDVTGAGDTFIAYLAAELAKGTDILEAVKIANYAAGVQVSKTGTSIVYPKEVFLAMHKYVRRYQSKQLNHYLPNGLQQLEMERNRGKKIVFTNGCFDIIHAGHIVYLNEAADLGDILVIGVNSDESIKRLKGEKRPINQLEDRLLVLASLECVDYVIPFEEDTPLDLIKAVGPDVLVKGADYRTVDIVGADFVESTGGLVTTIPLVEGRSTTDIINRILTEK